MASALKKAVGLEARAREQPGVPNPGGCVLLIGKASGTPRRGIRSAQRAGAT